MARYTRQPGQFRIDWSNPLTQGLVFCVPGAYGHWADLVTGRQPTITGGSLVPMSTDRGVIGNFADSTSVDWTAFGSDEIATSTPATVAWIQQGAATSGDTVFHFHPNGSAEAFYVYMNPGIGSDYNFAAGAGGSSGVQFNQVGSLVDGVTHRFCLVASNGLVSLTASDWALFYDDAKLANTGSVAAGPGSATTIRVGALAGNSDFLAGGMGQICIWKRALSDEEARSYQANPYQIYVRRTRRSTAEPVPGGALTGVQSTGAVGTVTASSGSVVAVTGTQASGAVGNVGSVVAPVLSNVSASAAVGDLVASATSLSVGSRYRNSKPFPGNDIFRLARFHRTRRSTSIVPVGTAGLAGMEGTSATGTVGVDFVVALQGVVASGVAGALAPANTGREGGRRRAGGVFPGQGFYSFARFSKSRRNYASLGTAIQGLAGNGAVSSLGTLQLQRSVALSGTQAVGAAGSVGATQAGNATLSSVAAVTAVGGLAVSTSRALSSATGTGGVGTVQAVLGNVAVLDGVEGLGQARSPGVDVAVRLSGVVAATSVGSTFGSTPGTWRPVNAAASVEGWTPINT